MGSNRHQIEIVFNVSWEFGNEEGTGVRRRILKIVLWSHSTRRRAGFCFLSLVMRFVCRSSKRKGGKTKIINKKNEEEIVFGATKLSGSCRTNLDWRSPGRTLTHRAHPSFLQFHVLCRSHRTACAATNITHKH